MSIIRDTGGNMVGRNDNGTLRDIHGSNWVGTIRGGRLYDTGGNYIGEFRGDHLYDAKVMWECDTN